MGRLLFLMLLVSTVAGAGIHRWVDEEGRTHFGDQPPARYNSTEIQADPPPSDASVRDALERAQRLRERLPREKTDAQEGEETGEPPPPAHPPALKDLDPDCFSRIEAAWGGRVADSREGVTRVSLTDAEQKRLTALFRGMTGYGWGGVEETICIQPEAEAARKVYRYDARTEVRERSTNLFRIEAELRGSENRSILWEYLWFLLDDEGLRFRKVFEDIIVETDQPGNDVEMLDLGKNEVLFYWRRGGSARRTNLLYLVAAGRRFNLREYFYVQGVLAEKRVWVIGD